MFGRARRIEFVKKLIFIAICLVLIGVSVYFIFKVVDKPKQPVAFSYLNDYFYSKGYSCEMLTKSGGHCSLTQDGLRKSFIRYDSGFQYFIKTDTYSIEIKHMYKVSDSITFYTNEKAFDKYKDKKYNCTTDNSVIGNLKKCMTDEAEILTLNSYLGQVESAINDLNDILNHSGYDKEVLIEEFVWK